MSLIDWLREDSTFNFIAGVGGAAAMAMTDWTGKWQLLRHVAVGTLCATFATPYLYPGISWVLSWMHVDPDYKYGGAAFMVGAFGIYVLELARAIFRYRISKGGEA